MYDIMLLVGNHNIKRGEKNMKKILALLLAVIMLLSLTACKSKEQKAADEFLKDMEKLIDEMIEAIEDEDEDALDELYEDLEKMGEDYEDILEDLEDKDEDAAEEFEEDVEKLGEKMEEAMEEAYGY